MGKMVSNRKRRNPSRASSSGPRTARPSCTGSRTASTSICTSTRPRAETRGCLVRTRTTTWTWTSTRTGKPVASCAPRWNRAKGRYRSRAARAFRRGMVSCRGSVC
uniref:(northern house mosquito) hypothetical protein n=1 Tax=Culex pipiens TaxID=7175 RepID=A0A8D8EUA3_CULPI